MLKKWLAQLDGCLFFSRSSVKGNAMVYPQAWRSRSDNDWNSLRHKICSFSSQMWGWESSRVRCSLTGWMALSWGWEMNKTGVSEDMMLEGSEFLMDVRIEMVDAWSGRGISCVMLKGRSRLSLRSGLFFMWGVFAEEGSDSCESGSVLPSTIDARSSTTKGWMQKADDDEAAG